MGFLFSGSALSVPVPGWLGTRMGRSPFPEFLASGGRVGGPVVGDRVGGTPRAPPAPRCRPGPSCPGNLQESFLPRPPRPSPLQGFPWGPAKGTLGPPPDGGASSRWINWLRNGSPGRRAKGQSRGGVGEGAAGAPDLPDTPQGASPAGTEGVARLTVRALAKDPPHSYCPLVAEVQALPAGRPGCDGGRRWSL